MTRNDFIHHAIITMIGDSKKFSIGSIGSNDQIETIIKTACKLADEVKDAGVAPWDPSEP